MVPLDVNVLAKMLPTETAKLSDVNERIREAMTDPKFRKDAGTQAGIPEGYQGPVFFIDEIVKVKGEKFRVRGFEGGLLHLQGVPRT